jgi:Domain of unknown function (DUF4158)
MTDTTLLHPADSFPELTVALSGGRSRQLPGALAGHFGVVLFFLDDDDLELVRRHRGEHIRAGFALQLTTVRWLGTFLGDPLNVPGEVLDFIAGQLGVAGSSQVKRYTEREKTRFDHQWEIRRARGYREFADAEAEFSGWVAARSRATGDGPKAIFADGLAWLRERKVLLPGVTTLARLVASVRDESTRQMWEELARLPDPAQRRALDRLPEVPHGPGCRTWNGGAGARRRAAARKASS